MASSASGSGRRRPRGRPNVPVDETIEDDVVVTGQQTGTCIDLTSDSQADTSLPDLIDLTNSHSIMDSPVVVLTHADIVGPTRRRRGSGRLGRRRSGSGPGSRRNRGLPAGLYTSPRSRTQTPVRSVNYGVSSSAISDSDEEELPDIPFPLPPTTPNVNSPNASAMQSPEAVQITCPICLDDVKQIRRSQRQVMSTTCGHIFCDECINTAIRTQKSCPSCRKKLTKNSIHPLFL